MSAEVEVVEGVGSMFSVRLTPWHKYGFVLTDAPSYDEAIRLGRLDYPVRKFPVKVTLPTIGGDDTYEVESKTAFTTWRTDTNVELGSVGPDYKPVQNMDAFRVLEPLIDKGVLALETGGVLRGGADAWLMGKWDIEKFGPITQEVYGRELIPYALVATNHSGRRGILVKKVATRVVCANTLGSAEGERGEGEIIRHTGDAHERLVEAAERLFLNFVEENEVIAAQYRAMKTTFLTDAEFKRLVLDPVTADPRSRKGWNPEARMAEVVIGRYDKRVNEITRLWTAGAGHTGDHSAWEAYNGVAEALDHNEELWPARSGVYRTQKLLDGDLAQMKRTVLGNLVAVSTK